MGGPKGFQSSIDKRIIPPGFNPPDLPQNCRGMAARRPRQCANGQTRFGMGQIDLCRGRNPVRQPGFWRAVVSERWQLQLLHV